MFLFDDASTSIFTHYHFNLSKDTHSGCSFIIVGIFFSITVFDLFLWISKIQIKKFSDVPFGLEPIPVTC